MVSPSSDPRPEFFAGFANTLAEIVEAELEARRIQVLASEERVEAFRHVDRNIGGTPGVYQVSLLEAWPDDAAAMPAREFLYGWLKRWAINMALKLARTGVLTTYPMILPKGVGQAVLGRSDNLILRCVLDYSMHDDMQVLRVDALARWDE